MYGDEGVRMDIFSTQIVEYRVFSLPYDSYETNLDEIHGIKALPFKDRLEADNKDQVVDFAFYTPLPVYPDLNTV